MDATFALRRKEVVKDKPEINQLVQRWPALFTESQVCMMLDFFFLIAFHVLLNFGLVFFVFLRFSWSLTELLEETSKKSSLVPLME